MPRQPKTKTHQPPSLADVQTVPDRRIISLDMGNAYCNMQADGGIVADWRSVQGSVSDAKAYDDLPFDHMIGLDGQWWVFGEKAYTYAPRSIEDYPAINRYWSVWYQRMFGYVLHRAYGLRLGDGPFYPEVVLSIPARLYSNDGLVQKVKDNLARPYVIKTTLGTELQAEMMADNLRIIPEGAGSYLSAAITNPALGRGTWYVIDVGYLTTDIVVFMDGDYVPDLATSSDQAGLRTVAHAIQRFIAAQTSVDLPESAIDAQLNCPTIAVNAAPVDIQYARDKALEELTRRIEKFVSQTSAGQNLSGLLLTGGGADLLHKVLRIPGLPQITVAPNPRRANVQGAFKLLED